MLNLGLGFKRRTQASNAGVIAQLVSTLTGSPTVRSPISLPLSPDSSQIHKHFTGDYQVGSNICCLEYESIGYVRTTLHPFTMK